MSASLLAALALAIGAAPAAGSVTLGQLGPNSASSGGAGVDFIQLAVSSGNSYQVPESGTITSWSHNATPAAQTLTMKVFRKVTDPNIYRVIGLDGPQNLKPGQLNTFPTNIPVQAGDIIGLNCLSSNSACLPSAAPGDTFLFRGTLPTNLGLGEAGTFGGPSNGSRLNLSAVLEPSNTVTLGATALNKKKGTATLNLTLPNPGDLTASGNGVKTASAGQAVISKAVAAGPAQLLIKAKGKKRKALNETGKVKLSVAISFTPTNGDPATQSVTVKLKKR